jgi:uncharacterized membrane protein YqaE (UPF0057 family)
MIGIVFGIILPLVGVWVTKSALAAAKQADDISQG